jgi:hypothetical protein
MIAQVDDIALEFVIRNLIGDLTDRRLETSGRYALPRGPITALRTIGFLLLENLDRNSSAKRTLSSLTTFNSASLVPSRLAQWRWAFQVGFRG